MSILGYIILFTFIGGVVSLIGGILLLAKERFAVKISHFLASFAAGALLGTAFLDLLPEASEVMAEDGAEVNIWLWVLVGMLVFFLMERFIHWFHHHHVHQESKEATVPLIVLGDSLHNFIDGVAIAAAFLVNIPLGIATALAVGAHEIPQEIGDFGVLLNRGMSRLKVLWVNLLSSLAAIIGALLTYSLGEAIHGSLPIFLALTAGFFIYIAASDLIPEIHNEERRGVALVETILLFLGVISIWLVITLLGGASH